MKPKFIVIEGGEGAGKSSQIKKLKDVFGDSMVVTREPGGSPYAEEIRNIILHSPNASQADARTHFGLFWAGRADHIKNTVRPALDSGKSVLTDRFDSSTFAYQIYGQGAEELRDFFWKMREFYLTSVTPDLYIYLDVDVATGLARKSTQGAEENNHFDLQKTEFHQRLREGFMDFFKHVPHRIIDANRSFDAVHEDLVSVLKETIV